MTNKAKHLIQEQDVRAKFPFLIKITVPNASGSETSYYCNADEDIVYNSKTYKSAIFKLNPPEITSTSIGKASIEMTSVDQEWIRKIRSAQERATIEFVAVIQYEETQNNSIKKYIEPIYDNTFTLTNATWNEISIKWTMVFDDKWDIKIPCIICDSINCNGVF